MAAICYLDIDDEITAAIGRLRAVKGDEAVLVVPPGSHIGSSRINFKLLARDAAERKLNLVAVSDEPQVRALAISAGLPAYDSIASAEKALVSFREQDRALEERLGRGAGAPEPPVSQATRVMPVAARTPARHGLDRVSTDTAVLPAAARDEPGSGAAAAPRRRRRRRGLPIAPLVVLLLVVLLVGGAAYGAYVFLPTASITLRPAATELRPEPFTVTADANVAVVDTAAGIIPAERVSIPLRVSGQFAATGVQTLESRATGSVRFRSENTVDPVTIAAGTIVSTSDGVEFETLADVVVPRADFASSTPGTANVDVRAVRPGPRGNVDSGTISEVPDNLRAQLVSVRNPEATSGGKRVEQPAVSQADYDAALAALNAQLPSALAARLANPGVVPRGLVAFGDTADFGEPQADPPASDAVDSVATTFSLALETNVEVVAVNEGLLDEVAAARVKAELGDGQTLVGGDVEARHDAGTVAGRSVVYQVTASGFAYSAPDPEALVGSIRGQSVADARATLERFGSVEISIWPDFVDRIPEQAARINLTVLPPLAAQ